MDALQDLVCKHITQSIQVKQKMLEEQISTLIHISQELIRILYKGGTVYLCGNGGSAADAQHVAAELVGRYTRERKSLAVIALTTDTSILTAIGNDYGFEDIFARQVQGLFTAKDALVAISTSGRSPNILKAVKSAKELRALTIGFTGTPGEPLTSNTDMCLCVRSGYTAYIQEAHIMAWHIICDLIERHCSEAASVPLQKE